MGWDKPMINPFKDKKYLVTVRPDANAWFVHKKSCSLVPNEKVALLERRLADAKEQLAVKDEQIKGLIQVLREATDCEQGNWSRHKKSCSLVPNEKDARIAILEKHLADTKEQLAARDEQIKELIQVAKKPRTVNNNNTTNNRYVVEQHINVFGKESIEHITPKQIQALLADPANAVPQFIKLKHRRAPGGVNQNLRVPNQKRAIYQVVVAGEGEEKEWENKAKGEVLETLYDENSGHLEAEADEETRVGSQFLDHQEKVKASVGGEDGGRRYKEQLDKIHNVLTNL